MLALLEVVVPVFLVIGAGYLLIRFGVFPISLADELMRFTQGFAIPLMLFKAIAELDLSRTFDPALLISFYTGGLTCFCLGIVGARLIFRRRPGEAVALGFAALFSNTVLLGLPITERAYGTAALDTNFAIIALHAPFGYLLGITAMEISRADGVGPIDTARAVVRAMFRNALTIGLLLGFAVNLLAINLPPTASAAIDMVVRAALPTALFGLGGVLTRYGIRGSLGAATMVVGLSLILHPLITYGLATAVFALPIEVTRSAVVTAAMAPGVNAYVFASLYNRAMGAAATAVILGTLLCVLTTSVWLAILGTP